jgi:hypothetical protein
VICAAFAAAAAYMYNQHFNNAARSIYAGCTKLLYTFSNAWRLVLCCCWRRRRKGEEPAPTLPVKNFQHALLLLRARTHNTGRGQPEGGARTAFQTGDPRRAPRARKGFYYIYKAILERF